MEVVHQEISISHQTIVSCIRRCLKLISQQLQHTVSQRRVTWAFFYRILSVRYKHQLKKMDKIILLHQRWNSTIPLFLLETWVKHHQDYSQTFLKDSDHQIASSHHLQTHSCQETPWWQNTLLWSFNQKTTPFLTQTESKKAINNKWSF